MTVAPGRMRILVPGALGTSYPAPFTFRSGLRESFRDSARRLAALSLMRVRLLARMARDRERGDLPRLKIPSGARPPASQA